ncbi:MAG: PQQ-binding-like beta-propeller repeat protein, partial [Phycisphaerae bacterium]
MKARIYTASMFVLLAIVAAVALADWPEFLGPNRNAMVEPKENLAQSWPEKGPKLHWQFDLEPGYGGAAVKDGRVYIMDREGKERDLVYCIDLKTGKEVWKFSYEAKGSQKFQGARAVPAVDDKRVYTVGPFGHVHCLDRKSKQVVWAKSYKDDFGIRSVRWGHASAPLLYKEWVILAPQSKTVGIVACERETGKVAWKSPSVGEAAHS